MHANNETGVLQPVEEIAAIAREAGVLLHCDGVQAAGRIPVDVRALGVDLYAISGHKFNAPKGVGALLTSREGVKLRPRQVGGRHERERRAGTENVPGIVAMAAAARLPRPDTGPLRDRFEQLVLERIPDVIIHGRHAPRVPNTSCDRLLPESTPKRWSSPSTWPASPSAPARPALPAPSRPVSRARGDGRARARCRGPPSASRWGAAPRSADVEALVERARGRRGAPPQTEPRLCVKSLPTHSSPSPCRAASTPPPRPRCSSEEGRRIIGLTMQLWNQRRLPRAAGRKRHRPLLLARRCLRRPRRRRPPGHPSLRRQPRGRLRAHRGRSRSSRSTSPAARPSPAPAAITTSSSTASSTSPPAPARPSSPPAITRASDSMPHTARYQSAARRRLRQGSDRISSGA